MGVRKLNCNRCGYEWKPRTKKRPKVCANRSCKSPYWDKPRVFPKRKKHQDEKVK